MKHNECYVNVAIITNGSWNCLEIKYSNTIFPFLFNYVALVICSLLLKVCFIAKNQFIAKIPATDNFNDILKIKYYLTFAYINKKCGGKIFWLGKSSYIYIKSEILLCSFLF